MKAVIFFVLALIAVVLASQECSCPKNLMPVCDVSTGKKYPNSCYAFCDGSVAVTKCNGTPVKGDDDEDDDIESDALLQAITSLLDSTTETPVCRCHKVYMPVCDINGKLYHNTCMAKCEGAVLSGAKPVNGKCPKLDKIIDLLE